LSEDSLPILDVNSLVTGYSKKQVVNGVTLQVKSGEVVALIGPNGAGKSTILKAIFGLVPIWEGEVSFDSGTLRTSNQRELLRAGITYIPQGNRVFTDLSVYENLEMAGVTLDTKEQLSKGMERVFSLFPPLKSRLKQRASTLSGGEKQMLALANALVLSPRLLLLDEPSLGLAPPLMSESFERIKRMSSDHNVAALVVEQKVREVLKVAHRVYVIHNGTVTFSGAADTLASETKLREVFLKA
jgi:ABC-type branched-subunit amino acid transport system ATPase component